MLNRPQSNDLLRWYDLPNMKPVHWAYYNCLQKYRFTVGLAGRRSYKTEIAKRIMIETAMSVPGEYVIGAPTIPQVKKIYWKDMVNMSFRSVQKSTPNKTDLIIPFDNGSTIQLMGLDNPKRFEGSYITGCLLDEFAYFKDDAWPESIRPALDTPIPGMPLPWCIIISKPNGLNHFHDRYQYAKSGVDPQWGLFQWTSEDVLPPEAIAAAKRELSSRQYRQEYLAEFVTQTGRIYDEYSELNYTKETIKDYEQIHYFCDFNYTPMSHGIAVIRTESISVGSKETIDKIYVLDEVILTSAEGHMNALEFCEKYKEHKNKVLYLYGDASGKAGEKHSLASEYLLMEEVFKKYGWKVTRRVKPANPGIKDRHNTVNALIKSADNTIRIYVNPALAPWMHKGLLTTVLKEGSTFQEEQKNNDYQHITTGLGYMCDWLFPIEYLRDPNDYIFNDIYGVNINAY